MDTVVTITRHNDEAGQPWEASVPPLVTDDELARAMTALFIQVASRPGLDLMSFQFKMAGAMRDAMAGAPAPPPAA